MGRITEDMLVLHYLILAVSMTKVMELELLG